jgi:hypothetical protein
MAFVTNNTLFIHVQKTGGMSVRRALYKLRPIGRETGDAESERHIGLPELRASHPGIENGRLSFGFVRNPVSWLVSRWAFAVETGYRVHIKHRGSAAAVWMAACWSEEFDTFIGNYLERYPGIATQTMFRMLGLWSEKPVDRVARTEHLVEDLTNILHEAGESDIEIDHRTTNGTSRAIRERARITTDMRSRIMLAEKQLCDRFGYY